MSKTTPTTPANAFPGLHPSCKRCRYYGDCNDDECADLADALNPGRAEMMAAIDDADNNRAGW
jgi:hypothetical protein